MMHTIDDLLEEVNRVAKAPTIEDLRKSVTNNVIQVYRKVDAPTLWQGAVHHYVLADFDRLKLPPYCVVPLSLVTGRMPARDFGETGRYQASMYSNWAGDRLAGYPVPFNQNGDQIWLESLNTGRYPQRYDITGDLTLSYWRIPLDEDESPLIDDRIYNACVLFCQANEARIGLHGRNAQSFSGVPYQVDKQEANMAIDAARAECNRMTPNNWLSFFTSFKSPNQTMKEQSKSELLEAQLQSVLDCWPGLTWPSDSDKKISVVRLPWWKIYRWKRESDSYEKQVLAMASRSHQTGLGQIARLLTQQKGLVFIHRPTKKPSEYMVYLLVYMGWDYIGIKCASIES